jgi:hypothetical protein
MLTVICIIGAALIWTTLCAWLHQRAHGKGNPIRDNIDKIIK